VSQTVPARGEEGGSKGKRAQCPSHSGEEGRSPERPIMSLGQRGGGEKRGRHQRRQSTSHKRGRGGGGEKDGEGSSHSMGGGHIKGAPETGKYGAREERKAQNRQLTARNRRIHIRAATIPL
jgi:hypothetical protein